MRNMTVIETMEACGGWTVKCRICGKKVKVGFIDWLFQFAGTQNSFSNYHAGRKGGLAH